MMGIYKITSPTGRVYIGQSTNIENRWGSYKRYRCSKQPKLFRSLKKYGHEKHKFEIICECDFNELNKLENFYQEIYSCTGLKGLNCVIVGSHRKAKRKKGVKCSEETRKKISKANKGTKPTEYCLKKGKESLIFRMENGLPVGMKNKKHTPEAIEKIKEKRALQTLNGKTRIGIKHSEEARKNLSLNSGHAKKVIDTKTGVFYRSLAEACRVFGLNESTVGCWLLYGNEHKTSLRYA